MSLEASVGFTSSNTPDPRPISHLPCIELSREWAGWHHPALPHSCLSLQPCPIGKLADLCFPFHISQDNAATQRGQMPLMLRLLWAMSPVFLIKPLRVNYNLCWKGSSLCKRQADVFAGSVCVRACARVCVCLCMGLCAYCECEHSSWQIAQAGRTGW